MSLWLITVSLWLITVSLWLITVSLWLITVSLWLNGDGMLNSDIKLNSKYFPNGFRRDFDAHVYFTPEARDKALKLRERALADFAEATVFVGSMIDRPVGPHPIPMFEMNFPRELLGQVLLWLLHQRRELTVLVHEVTGDDPRDHSAGAIWLGDRLALDVSKFDPSPTSPSSLQP